MHLWQQQEEDDDEHRELPAYESFYVNPKLSFALNSLAPLRQVSQKFEAKGEEEEEKGTSPSTNNANNTNNTTSNLTTNNNTLNRMQSTDELSSFTMSHEQLHEDQLKVSVLCFVLLWM